MQKPEEAKTKEADTQQAGLQVLKQKIHTTMKTYTDYIKVLEAKIKELESDKANEIVKP